MKPSSMTDLYERELDGQKPDQAAQARCVDMPNDEPEGHYWSWNNDPQSIPSEYRKCMICGRLDASEWHTKAVVAELEKLKQYNGAYIGIDGKRVDNMVHHSLIDEAIKALQATAASKDPDAGLGDSN